jgi:adenosylhomocysteine nucleosidase
MCRVVIISALEREVAPLVKGWRVLRDPVPAAYRKFQKDGVVVVCGGVGARAARRATEGALDLYRPGLVVSTGLAGALVPELKVGEVLVPAVVVSAATQERFTIPGGTGVLVTASGVAGSKAKRLLAGQHSGQLVDMEAAAVAEVAKRRGAAFTAVKAISDDAEFDFPDLGPFTAIDGRFLTGRFAAHAALRPWLWRDLAKLASNSVRATRELCAALEHLIEKRQSGESFPPRVAM